LRVRAGISPAMPPRAGLAGLSGIFSSHFRND
jgi:hypothetical protein